MRTNIVIDDDLMTEVMQSTGAASKREAVEMGLKTLLRLARQGEIRRYRGAFRWSGDLDEMRSDG